jgi:hypothetical protein
VDFLYRTDANKRDLQLKFRKTYGMEGYNLIATLLDGVEALFVTVDMHDVRTAKHLHSVAYQLVSNYPLIVFCVRVLVLFDDLAVSVSDYESTPCTDADIKPIRDLLNIEKTFIVHTATDVYECAYYVIDEVSHRRNTAVPMLNLERVVNPISSSRGNSGNNSGAQSPLASASSSALPKANSAPATTRARDAVSPARESSSARRRSRLLLLRMRNSSPAIIRPEEADTITTSGLSSASSTTPQDCASVAAGSPLESPKRPDTAKSSKKQSPLESPKKDETAIADKKHPYESESCDVQ